MIRLITAVFLLWGLLPNPYAYYMLLRVVVCGVSGYTAYGYARAGSSKIAWTFGGLALLYNPFLPVYLTREIWMPIDLLTAIFLFWSVLRDRHRLRAGV